MKKGKKRRRKSTGNKVDNKVFKSEKIDESTLSRAIVDAYRIIQKEKKDEEIDLERKLQSEWYEIIGQRNYPQDDKQWKKKVHSLRNKMVAFWKLLFMKPNEVRDPRATFALISLAIIGIFDLCKWGLYLFSIISLVLVFMKEIQCILGIPAFLFSWVLARVFRVAGFEVEKLRDGNLLMAIFSGSLSFVAVILAIISLVFD